jgi:hypothetical protein
MPDEPEARVQTSSVLVVAADRECEAFEPSIRIPWGVRRRYAACCYARSSSRCLGTGLLQRWRASILA